MAAIPCLVMLISVLIQDFFGMGGGGGEGRDVWHAEMV